MFSTYRLKADELTADFVKAIKNTYQHREIEIIIHEVQDETEYLLQSPANKEHLMTALEDFRNKKNLVTLPLDSFE